MVELTDEQRAVKEAILNDIADGVKDVRIGGFAGAGKSLLVSKLVEIYPNFAFMAYTGKATQVLRDKGVYNARTIHSTIYKPIVEWGYVVGFDLKDIADLEEEGIEGFIIDEASMVPKAIYEDLMSFDLPCIFVGDHGQLEPIGDDFNLMADPDYRLETIHRNAGDIARFAELLRNGEDIIGFNSPKVRLIDRNSVSDQDLLSVDQVICAYNVTRCQINKRIREAKGLSGPVRVGERVICLRNNKKAGVFNGMQGIVRKLKQAPVRMDFEVDGFTYGDLKYDPQQFGKETRKEFVKVYAPIPFDWAYCCTGHKMQGSEVDRVLVIVQDCKHWDHARWSYTCASRAKEHLTWAF